MKVDKKSLSLSPEPIEIRAEKKKELTFLNCERKVKGHIIFEYNRITGKIVPADYKQNDIYVIGRDAETEIFVKKDCLYVQALNKENALKRVKRKL